MSQVSFNDNSISSMLSKGPQTGILPDNRKSLLLAPTENVIFPAGLAHPCLTTSHTLRSYRESVTVTVFFSPFFRNTSAKPRSTDGGSPADAGWCRYSCGISPPSTSPVFFTLNSTCTSGRCSHSAVDEPSAIGVALPAAHAFSRSDASKSVWEMTLVLRREYSNVVYDSPKPNSKRGVMFF